MTDQANPVVEAELQPEMVAELEKTAELMGMPDVAPATGLPVIIRPTIGRVVLFRPDAETAAKLNMIDKDLATAQPMTAQIVYVHDDYKVNIAGFDQYGHPFSGVNVALLTGNEAELPAGPYVYWMDYQLAQALKG
jgi:hypothetical protein